MVEKNLDIQGILPGSNVCIIQINVQRKTNVKRDIMDKVDTW